MNESVHLGRVGGVRIGVHWSVLIIASLITVTLAAAEFPAVAPGFPRGAYWSAAIATTVLFFVSLVAHELSHARVAKRRGLSVNRIVLWALGGVAEIGGDAPDARAELRVALVGPATSLALAVVFGLGAVGLGVLGASRLFVVAIGWLAEINAVLGVFNLLPAYPLDGGRILRAGLWKHWNDRFRATDAAARIGTAFGAGMIALGAFATLFIADFPLNGVWLALIGWFVLGASRKERASLCTAAALSDISARDAMQPFVGAVPDYALVEDVLERHLRPCHLEHCALIDFSGTPSGVVGIDEIARVPVQYRTNTRASQVAWPLEAVARADARDDLAGVARRLALVPSRCALVFEGGHPIGIVSLRDVERVARFPGAYRRSPSAEPFLATRKNSRVAREVELP